MAVQLISHAGEFREQEFTDLIRQQRVRDNTTIRSVSIAGPQNKGKSTIANLLWGTDFKVLAEGQVRTKTTQGIWVSPSRANPEIFVYDVQGTDSATGSIIYDNKFSLFALCITDVFIINIKEDDIDCNTSSGMSVLQVILEAYSNLQRENYSIRKKIVFFIRDYDGDENSDKWSRTKNHIEAKIFNLYQNLRFTPMQKSLIKIEFYSFPHKRLEAKQFNIKLSQVKRRFAIEIFEDTDSPNQLNEMHNFKTIWESIKSDESLNILSQIDQKIYQGCKKIYDNILQNFVEFLRRQKKRENFNPNKKFYKNHLLEKAENSLAAFKIQTQNKPKKIYQEFYSQLKEKTDNLVADAMIDWELMKKLETEKELERLKKLETEKELERLKKLETEKELERLKKLETEKELEKLKKKYRLQKLKNKNTRRVIGGILGAVGGMALGATIIATGPVGWLIGGEIVAATAVAGATGTAAGLGVAEIVNEVDDKN